MICNFINLAFPRHSHVVGAKQQNIGSVDLSLISQTARATQIETLRSSDLDRKVLRLHDMFQRGGHTQQEATQSMCRVFAPR